MQLQQTSDLSSHSLVPKAFLPSSFCSFAVCILRAIKNWTLQAEWQEGLGTRLTSQIPPKGVYSSVARESGYGRDPLVVGVALERLK